MVLLVNKTRLYILKHYFCYFIHKFMTKYSEELSDVYVRNRGIAQI